MFDTDVLVVGSGIAGLTYALHVNERCPDADITIVTKERLHCSSSLYAQGGVAAVTDLQHDSFDKHVSDTLAAGDGLNNRRVVDFVVREAPARIAELANWGVRFDKTAGGKFDLAREGGHSARRILHAADCTGAEIMQKLIVRVRTISRIRVLEEHLAADLVCNDERCTGSLIFTPGGKLRYISARITMIATGGLGQIFMHTTNPAVATGDGIAMAWRAGAKIADMEFIQFHPTAMWQKESGTSFLISEAVRGEGGILRNNAGERFMGRYDRRLELATRDVVARAVQTEIACTGSDRVYLDCTAIPKSVFSSHFPGILQKCLQRGIDPAVDFIPVTPSAHYCCGGIVTDHAGRTNIPNLYAAGECARTGLHGANRLASNSLLEALVFSRRAAYDTNLMLHTKEPSLTRPKKTSELPFSDCRHGDFSRQLALLRKKMSAAAIVIRQKQLAEAFTLVTELRNALSVCNCRSHSPERATYGNLLDAAYLVLDSWNERQVNRGAFFKEQKPALA